MARNLFDLLGDLPGQRRALLFKEARDSVHRALANPGAGQIDAAHAGLRREWHELGMDAAQIASAEVVLLLGQNDDGAALGSFVGERG